MKKKYKTYNGFLKGNWWKKIRKMFGQIVKKECWVCGSNKRLNLHHRNYNYLNLKPTRKNFRIYIKNSLVWLCKKCHQELHFENGVKLKLDKNGLEYLNIKLSRMRKVKNKEFVRITTHFYPYKELKTPLEWLRYKIDNNITVV